MIITDFDGTLYTDSCTISLSDYNTMRILGEKGITRVIATGRSLYSSLKVIPDDFPIDYLVFSTGAGIMEWKEKNIIKLSSLTQEETLSVLEKLIKNRFDFMVHDKIPGNHYFLYHKGDTLSRDFFERINIYSSFCRELKDHDLPSIEGACQFVIVTEHDSESEKSAAVYLEIKEMFKNLKVVRTTSPISRKNMWIEIFPADVSKAEASAFIAKIQNIDYKLTAAVGNDYNDIDMLSWAYKAFVVSNAPEELRKQFTSVKSNNESGFTDAVKKSGLCSIL